MDDAAPARQISDSASGNQVVRTVPGLDSEAKMWPSACAAMAAELARSEFRANTAAEIAVYGPA
jgi:hypothetical protein